MQSTTWASGRATVGPGSTRSSSDSRPWSMQRSCASSHADARVGAGTWASTAAIAARSSSPAVGATTLATAATRAARRASSRSSGRGAGSSPGATDERTAASSTARTATISMGARSGCNSSGCAHSLRHLARPAQPTSRERCPRISSTRSSSPTPAAAKAAMITAAASSSRSAIQRNAGASTMRASRGSVWVRRRLMARKRLARSSRGPCRRRAVLGEPRGHDVVDLAGELLVSRSDAIERRARQRDRLEVGSVQQVGR